MAPATSPATWLPVLVVLLSQWCAGRVCLAWLWPAGRAPGGSRAPSGALSRALLLGPAALAVQMGLWHLAGIPFSLVTVLAPWWLVALVARRRVWPRPAPACEPATPPGGSPPPPAARRSRRIVTAAVALVTATSLGMAVATPVHTADGLNNFALPARVFATHADLAPERLAVLSLPGHLEYPPLVALNASLCMRAASLVDPGDAGLWAVKPFFVLPVLAFLLLAAELFGGRLRGAAAVPATLLACGIPTLLATPTAGMADLHLTAALLLLVVEGAAFFGRADEGHRDRPPGRRPARDAAPLLAAAGVCALTKDEGVAVAAVTATALLVGALRRPRPWGLPRGVPLIGAALLLALAGAWRAWLAWHDIAHETTLAWPAGGVAEAAARVPRILAHFATLPWSYTPDGLSPWGLLWPATLALAVLTLARGGGRVLLWPAVLLAAHLSLYVAVYAFNTQPLEWVLGNSAPRVFMHLLPWALLLLAAALAPDFARKADGPERPAALSAAGGSRAPRP